VRLRRAGFDMAGEASVPDELEVIRTALKRALESADLVVVCGGLGPTFDDITREAACAALGRELSFDPRLWKVILSRFARYRIAVPEENKRQAMRVEGAEILANRNGSAPGQLIRARGRTLVLLPGPPTEMYPMFEAVLPKLARLHARGVHPASFSVRLSGVPESVADERLDPVRARWPKARFTILASGGEVSFHATALESSPAAARASRAKLRREILAAVGEFAHGEGDATLEKALGERLKHRKLSLAVAESCTGGLLGGRITSVAGSSSYFVGGVLSYSNAVKIRQLRVPSKMIVRHGAVSQECASAMARGVRKLLRSDLGVAITGVAGPGGGTQDKPVGLVFVAVSGPGRAEAVKRLEINGPRDAVRGRAVTAALRLAFDSVS
ncbi:MAG: CinA family nicotinamide mononucleotide deamidase-related protein, partial [Elusimicrobia bacterium]|nr:CinA family nicotinamide mononucleotide deamidase-related protein [Elusimicrobiota bacterium]